MKFKKQMIVAHRGASGLVPFENTLAAFEKAIEVGADCIELDVHQTLDGELIVLHDDKFNGIEVGLLTFSEISALSQAIGFKIPKLSEALSIIKGKILVDVEIKEEGYETKIIDVIHEYLSDDEFYLRSFKDRSLIMVKKYDPKITTALLLGLEFPKHVHWTRFTELFPGFRLWRCRADYVSPYWKLVRLSYIWRMKLIGKPVSVWTVNEEPLMRRFLKEGAGSIVTNYPDLALKIRDETKKAD